MGLFQPMSLGELIRRGISGEAQLSAEVDAFVPSTRLDAEADLHAVSKFPFVSTTERLHWKVELSFSFPDSWQVTKYDGWEFYREHFAKQGDGIKAVDLLAILIAIPNGIGAFLIEAKDYRHPDALPVLPSKLADDVARKVRDTLAAVLPARLNAQVEAEQSFANSVLACRTLTVVLHVEQKSDAIDLAELKQKLRGKLRAVDANPKIVSKTQMQNLAWTVA